MTKLIKKQFKNEFTQQGVLRLAKESHRFLLLGFFLL